MCHLGAHRQFDAMGKSTAGSARRPSRVVSAKDLVEQAKVAKDAGQHQLALEKLQQAAKRGRAQSEVARYELALLHAQLGQHEESNRWLQELGFAWKLSPAILDGTCLLGSHTPGEENLVVAFDDALPLELLSSLQDAFKPEAAFWSEHCYPTPGFFSYNQSLEESSLTTLAAQTLERLAAKSFPEVLQNQRVTSLEWWAHSRPAGSGSGRQLHYDLDEVDLRALEEAATPKHPLVSCVLYLSGSASRCSVTMVTDQDLQPESRAKRAWLCEPKVNRALLFNGKLLHGVIPSLASPDSQGPRITLMLGLWGTPGPSCSPAPEGPGRDLGPNMHLPEKGFDWPAALEVTRLSSSKKPRLEVTEASPALLAPVSPVWCTVDTATGSPKRSSVDFLGKWFLQEAPEQLQRFAPRTIEVEEVSMEELERLRAASKRADAQMPPVDFNTLAPTSLRSFVVHEEPRMVAVPQFLSSEELESQRSPRGTEKLRRRDFSVRNE
ncbi:unnamed protein product [Durusdinium trenchii]|uniref:Fe2OG dioxygenase domain-containing protein n=2 Tax=Durusdinium trenchii TaxID=1381693 RepID=A0ABP0P0W2_9DINO